MNDLQNQIIKRFTQGPPPMPSSPASATRGYVCTQERLYWKRYFDRSNPRKTVPNGRLHISDLPGSGMPKSRAIKALERLGLIDSEGEGRGRMLWLTEEGEQYAAQLEGGGADAN